MCVCTQVCACARALTGSRRKGVRQVGCKTEGGPYRQDPASAGWAPRMGTPFPQLHPPGSGPEPGRREWALSLKAFQTRVHFCLLTVNEQNDDLNILFPRGGTVGGLGAYGASMCHGLSFSCWCGREHPTSPRRNPPTIVLLRSVDSDTTAG